MCESISFDERAVHFAAHVAAMGNGRGSWDCRGRANQREEKEKRDLYAYNFKVNFGCSLSYY